MSAEEFSRYDSMKLFLHQIYEFQKGVRSLVLCTMSAPALLCSPSGWKGWVSLTGFSR